MKRQALTVLAASSLAIGAVAAPYAYAGEEKSQHNNVEQSVDGMQRAITDAWLDGKLETALLLNEHLNSFSIDTEVQNNVAILSGTVESDIDRDLAVEIARSVDGVSKVKDMLVVDKQKADENRESDAAMSRNGFRQSIANATLTARIKTELLVNSNTAGLSIDVDSDDGQVTLSGEVESDQEKELAERIAENTDGAYSVDNQLTVASSS